MKKTLLIVAMAVMFTVSEAQIQTPAASPAGSVSSTIGLTEVKIDYFRPRLKGRKIFGEKDVMYPHGSIWRTGANSGTKISFSDDVKVEGIDVPKGEYLIFTWPNAGEWGVALYKDLSLGGNTNAYDPSKEAAKFKVKTRKLPTKLKRSPSALTISLLITYGGVVTLAWENTAVPIDVTVDYDAKVMKSIEANTKVNPGNYFQAAVYYLQNGKDLNKALEWVNLALESNPTAYWMLHQKAQIQKALGDKKVRLKLQPRLLTARRKPTTEIIRP